MRRLKALFQKPVHNVDPLWENCQKLTGLAEWSDSESFDTKRSVTWGHYPFRYVLTEYAVVEKRSPPVTKAFELGRVGAMFEDTGMHDLDRFYVTKSGLIGAMHQEVLPVSDMTADDVEDFKDTIDFTIQYGLLAPNAEDDIEVESALKMADRDGVEPLG